MRYNFLHHSCHEIFRVDRLTGNINIFRPNHQLLSAYIVFSNKL
jgi:hypothetical protein